MNRRSQINQIHSIGNERHACSLSMFRRLRCSWLLYALIPSFALDVFLFYVVFSAYPLMLAAGEFIEYGYVWRCILPFLMNALFLKVPALVWYRSLLSCRRNSYLESQGQVLCYFRVDYVKIPGIPADDLVYRTVFRILQVRELKLREDGSIVIEGDIEKKKYHDDNAAIDFSGEGDIPAKKTITKLVIPGYFEQMDTVYTMLNGIRSNLGEQNIIK